MISKEFFGLTPLGKKVFIYSLSNENGITARFLNYGLILQSLLIPDIEGKQEDVVLGYDNLENYLSKNNPYFGAIVGRFGNRIANACFSINGDTYNLGRNERSNHLHGGFSGFDKKYWDIIEEENCSTPSITGKVISKDGEEGYPGDVHLTVKVSLTKDNQLVFNYEGSTTKPTILNPTHHSYFNLSGSRLLPAIDHKLQIHSDAFTPVSADMIPTGEICGVNDTPMDFRVMKTIRDDIQSGFDQIEYGNGFDHNWIINDYEKGKIRKAATVYEPKSGRLMEVFTDLPGMQFYSGNHLTGNMVGKGNIPYHKHGGLCFETQYYPDSPNHSEWPSPFLRPGQIYRHVTSYKFSVLN